MEAARAFALKSARGHSVDAEPEVHPDECGDYVRSNELLGDRLTKQNEGTGKNEKFNNNT